MALKRSRGITIFAWVFIILNTFNLLNVFYFQTYFELHKSFNKATVVALFSIGMLSSVIGFITGIGILRLNNIMRRIAIIVNSLDILIAIPLYFLSVNDIKQYCHSIALTTVAQGPPIVNVNVLANIGFYAATLFYIFAVGLSSLFIFFLTRPKIKEQFN